MDHLVALKNEQTARIVLRDTALYVQLGTIFGIYAAEGQAAANLELVEWIRAVSTLVSAVMLSIYMSNDYYVSRIGRFICSESSSQEFQRWESYHRTGVYYALQKYLRFALVLLIFGGWSAYQSIPVFEAGTISTRAITAIGSTCLLLELAFFISTFFDRRF